MGCFAVGVGDCADQAWCALRSLLLHIARLLRPLSDLFHQNKTRCEEFCKQPPEGIFSRKLFVLFYVYACLDSPLTCQSFHSHLSEVEYRVRLPKYREKAVSCGKHVGRTADTSIMAMSIV